MSINCTRCEGTGFLNNDQFPNFVDETVESRVLYLQFIEKLERTTPECFCEDMHPDVRPCSYCEFCTDAQICDCCGDGEAWYGVPGEHYNSDDPKGLNGPYSNNGGLCRCH